LKRHSTTAYHVQPFPGANLEPASLEITGIDPYHPLRPALPEEEALRRVFREVRRAVKEADCTRAILVGHNAWFDLAFLNAAIERTGIKRSPFHPFSSFDTVTLAGIAVGQTVLARAVEAVGMKWDAREAHSAVYDAEQTADLFCVLVNQMSSLYATMGNRSQ
jgi:ribonuclease T